MHGLVRSMAGALFLLWAAAVAAAAEDSAAGGLTLEVLQLKSSVSNERLRDLHRPVRLHLRVANRSAKPVTLRRDELQLLCDNRVCDRVEVKSGPALADEQELLPGDTTDGWIAFQLKGSSPEEPSLVLSTTSGAVREAVSLNQVLRDLVNPEAVRLGYRQQITVLSIDRAIDLPVIWVLDEQFRQLKQQGVERLVLDAHPPKSTRLPDTVSRWLQLANETSGSTRRRMVRGYRPPARFREFHLTGFQYVSNQYVNTSPGRIMHRSRELAVAAAARSLYRRLTTEDAVAEYQSEEAGIRRAALESSIDRMSADDLSVILESIPGARVADRRMILELLDRVPGTAGVETLRDTLTKWLSEPPGRSDALAPKSAAIAAQTLVRCVVPETSAALREVWTAAAANRMLRDTIIQEILRTQDHRWTSFVSEYATAELNRFTSTGSEAVPSQAGTPKPTRINRILRDGVRFLHGNDEEFRQVAKQRLLTVVSPDLQDELLRIVVEAGETRLAQACIEQRLEHGTVTRQLLNIIQQLPDPDWTMRLFELHSSRSLSSYDRASTLTTAIRCATDTQLDEIIDSAGELDRSVRPHLYRKLAEMGHPRCAELLANALEADETEFNRALHDLPASDSPEMLQLLIDRYELFRLLAIERGSLEGNDARMARAILRQLGVIDHPEARRMINLSLISPDPGLRSEGLHQLAGGLNRIPLQIRKLDSAVRQLRQQGKIDEALKQIDRLVEQDPFSADFLLTRASLRMRKGFIDEAEEDVLEADRLSPGDVFTESTLALLKVRTGRIEDGVSDAEAIMKLVPESAGSYYDGTLYNTACVYARALEQPEISAEQNQQYTDRAIDLMHQSADAGFHDENHVKNDPDLVTLHDHDEWPSIMQKITSNERR